MSLTIELPEDLEQELQQEAHKLGLSISEYTTHLLRTGRLTSSHPQTGAQLVFYWQQAGLIGSRSDITDSQTHARQIRAVAENRYRG